MQIFVRNLDDVDVAAPRAIGTLQADIANRTGIAVDAQRLTQGGRPLVDAAGLQPGCNLDLSARLRGGKKRCAFLVSPTERCSSPALSIIGDCPECQAKHCGRHRLPEDHQCVKLDSFRKSAFQLNKDKLEAEAAIANANAHNIA